MYLIQTNKTSPINKQAHRRPTFLGSTNLSEFGRPLSESLRVGPPAAAAVHLGVSRAVLPRRTGLPGRPAGRDEPRYT